MTEPAPEGASPSTYSTDPDVRRVLGTIGDRLPTWIEVDKFRELAHGWVVDQLSKVYPDKVPTFEGTGATVVRWAEAKFAAGEILDAIRVNIADPGEQPDQLRASAMGALVDGVVGYPPGGSTVDADGNPATPGVSVGPSPRVSSFTSGSTFPDPYEALRDVDGFR